MEVWKQVLGFEGYYEVSDIGRVRSVRRLDVKGVPRGGHLMKTAINCRSHYPVVKLCRDGKRKLCKIHILILEAFVCARPSGLFGLHKDDVKTNCSLSNLRWGTHAENIADKMKNNGCARGERNGGGGKLTATQVSQIKALLGTKTDRLIGADFGVSQSTIMNIKTGRTWAYVA